MKLTLALPFLLLAACQPTPPADSARAAVAAAEANLMQRHDSAMAQTGRLYDLKDKIGVREDGRPYVRGLNAADQAMTTWMNRYAPDTTKTTAQQLAYFQAQQAELATIVRRLGAALDSARTFVTRR